jgi:ankyrin repeat protein
MVAAHDGQRKVLKALLDLGADINAQGDQGDTALTAALQG